MTRLFVSLFLLAAVGEAHARDVCAGATTRTDALTGDSATTLVRGGLILGIEGDSAIVTMPVLRAGARPAPIPPGSEVLVVLENGTRVHFITMDPMLPGVDAESGYLMSTYAMTWTLTSEAAHAMAQSRPIAMRYTVGGVEMKPDYSKATGRTLQSFFACAAERIPAEG
jgi:hypothetical protein